MNHDFETIGRALVERHELDEKVRILELQLQQFATALGVLVGTKVTERGNLLHEESRKIVDSAEDPRELWKELKSTMKRLDEVQRIVNSARNP